jgi:hypothetical protein
VSDFFSPGDVLDERYQILRDDQLPIVVNGRHFVDSLWAQCQPYLDSDLPLRAQDSFQPCFWELYLAHTLLFHGVDLMPRERRRTRKKGPDLLLNDGVTWVEAVLPTGGEGADAITEPRPGTASWVPHDALKLRLLTAIREKMTKYTRYRETNVLAPRDRYVIAVGGSAIQSARSEQSIPRIVSSVLPFGAEQLHIDTTTLEIVNQSFAYQPSVEKRSGAQVRTTLFQDPVSAPISALLYAWADEINRPDIPGTNFTIVHNPLAVNPVPLGYFPFGTEYWFQHGQLHRKNHSVAGR